jgi:hypothetical protein
LEVRPDEVCPFAIKRRDRAAFNFFAHTQSWIWVEVRPWVAPTRGEATQSNRHDSEDSTHRSKPVTFLSYLPS